MTVLIVSIAGAIPIVIIVVVLAWLSGWDRGHTTAYERGFRDGHEWGLIEMKREVDR